MSQISSPLPSGGSRIRQRLIVALAGLGIILAIAWLALVILTRIDELFISSGIDLGPLTVFPGVEEAGEGATERINVLVMGLDRRPNETGAPARTDSMFVLTIDPQSETAGMLGIPRDLWVDYLYSDGRCCYQDRVNAAYVWGETRGYSGGGPQLAMDVIESNLGIPIDHYIVIDFDGFVEIIDGLGGITVYIETRLYDPSYSATEIRGDYLKLDVRPGEVVEMQGDIALGYARSRRNSSDLDRIRRQQQVIFAALEKARQLQWTDVTKIPGLWGDYRDAIQTDISDVQVLKFAGLASRIDPTRITALSIGAETVGWTTPDGKSVLLADKEGVQEMVLALFSDQRLLQESAQVEVQNGAGADGLALRAVDFLAGNGFPATLLTAGEAAGTTRPRTEIIDFSGKEYTVQRLAKLLDVSDDAIRLAEAADIGLRGADGTDILVILGSDAQTQDFAVEASGG